VTGPLRGLRVVEFAGIGPGPFAGMMLADMGADVVRIDRPDAAPYDPRDITSRGRPTVRLDLKSAAGVAEALQLVEVAGVLIEGFRPGVMERLGLGPAVALARNPALVYGRVTGWGQDGPLAQAAGHDLNYIAITGALATIGPPGGKPVPPLNLVGDYGGGALYLVAGVLAALFEASRSGRGQIVDAAMCDGAASLMAPIFAWAAQGQWVEQRGNNFLDGAAPYYTVYECADGGLIAVAPLEPKFYALLRELAGLADPEFDERDDKGHWPALRAKAEAVFRTRTRDAWCALLEGTDACFAPVLAMSEAPSHAHLAARKTFVEVDGVVQPAPAPRFSRTPSTLGQAGPHEPATVAGILEKWARSARRDTEAVDRAR
jgi:alpha-methylacyl-CoA racemase